MSFKPARIRKWRGAFYLVWRDRKTGAEHRRSCTALGAFTQLERERLLKERRARDSADAFEVYRLGSNLAFETKLVDAVARYRADVERRADLRRQTGTREGLSANSAAIILRQLDHLADWLRATGRDTLNTGEVDGAFVADYFAHIATTRGGGNRARGQATINKYRRNMRAMLNWLDRLRPRMIREIETLLPELKQHRTDRRSFTAFSPEQLRRFRRAARKRGTGKLFSVLALTGCRLGEALALRWRDVDLARGRVTIHASKTGRTRIVPLIGALEGEIAPGLLARMRKWAAKSKPERRVCGWKLWPRKRWAAAMREAESAIMPQRLRQNFTSYAASLGIPASVCALWQGHSAAVAEAHYRQQVLDRLPGASIEAAMGLG